MAKLTGVEHHADFAVPITHYLWVQTGVPRADGVGTIAGQAIALGWWRDAGQTDAEESTGTLYLIVDEEQGGPPVWIAEGYVETCRLGRS